ncbi:MAG: ABC transporter ATP-binding protein [Clostridiales bacterium]|nr:ABC transporter ATP-binding protein [Clostridiales bacterium]
MARNRYFEDEALEAKFNGKMILRVLSYIKPYKKTFITVTVFMIILGAIALLPSYFNRIIIDKILDVKGRVPHYVTLAIVILIAWALVAVSDILFNLVKTRALTKNSYKIVRDLRGELFRHLQKLSFDYFDSRPAGKILVRVTNYIDELANILSGAVIGFVTDSIKTILILGFLYVLDYRFALIVTASMVPLGFSLVFLRSKIHLRWRHMRNKSSNRTAYIAENINGIAVTKAFNRIDANCQIYDELNAICNKSWARVIRLNELFFPVMDAFWNIGQMGIYVAAYLIAVNFGAQTISAGLLVSFVGFMGLFFQPLNNISNYVQQLSVASSNLERIFETMDTPPSITDREGAYDLPPVQGHVKFENVSFAYEKGNNILENFNLEVPPGKTVALVGPTGAGKTTIVNLLSRFYEPTSGRILIDGHDINNVKLYSLRSQVSVMMQDSFVFSGTIMDNIRYARPDATDEECIKAAKAASLHEYIMQYPDGYNHVLGEKGAGLSGGEIQLLSFARTILCDPKILVLDEATSSVDTQTEIKIQQVLEKILKNRTSFIIAHRLSTIRKADCILYIGNKGILEAGTHEELMAKKGAYYQLQTKN